MAHNSVEWIKFLPASFYPFHLDKQMLPFFYAIDLLLFPKRKVPALDEGVMDTLEADIIH